MRITQQSGKRDACELLSLGLQNQLYKTLIEGRGRGEFSRSHPYEPGSLTCHWSPQPKSRVRNKGGDHFLFIASLGHPGFWTQLRRELRCFRMFQWRWLGFKGGWTPNLMRSWLSQCKRTSPKYRVRAHAVGWGYDREAAPARVGISRSHEIQSELTIKE